MLSRMFETFSNIKAKTLFLELVLVDETTDGAADDGSEKSTNSGESWDEWHLLIGEVTVAALVGVPADFLASTADGAVSDALSNHLVVERTSLSVGSIK